MGSTWGNRLKISIFGESHGQGIGVVIDGFPAGVPLDQEWILSEMARRAPGRDALTTKRSEKDYPNIVSGVLQEQTTGAPICIMIENTDTKSKDYEGLRIVPRPGHSDFTGQVRYQGANDIRGGGHFSGRLTAPLVFAGALCKAYLRNKKGIEIGSHLLQVGPVVDESFDFTGVNGPLLRSLSRMKIPVLEEERAALMEAAVAEAREQCDSLGGVIQCAVVGVEAGIGSPMFDNVESRLASILYGIPAVKGVSFGDGFALAEQKGSEANDCFVHEDDKIATKTNHNGGVLGGITTGMPIIVNVAIKPTPSIAKEQETLNVKTMQQESLVIHGRHDPCIAFRAPVVIEAAVALAMMDLYLEAYGYDIG